MGRVHGSIRGIHLQNGAAIDSQCKHDLLKPSLYFTINVFCENADETGGQIAQELLETR
ncbi:MAG: hypothetical protein ACLQAT_08140 [Candidatus Binataceae bacterium]